MQRKLRPSQLALPGIILIYLAVASLFAIFTPPWQAPDEPAHYNYVRYVAEQGALPVLQAGDYNEAYQRSALDARFAPGYAIAPFRYEFHQPPLYYMLGAVVYRLTHGALPALRLYSVGLGGLLLLVVYSIGRRLFAGRPRLALGATAFVAFLPMHTAILASVNNDSLAELTIALLLLQCLRLVQPASVTRAPTQVHRDWLLLGLICGLGLITKSTVYAMAPLVGLTLVLSPAPRPATNGAAWARARLVPLLLVAVPTLLLALPWWIRNISLYGGFDFLGLQRHDAIVQGQLRTAQFVADNGWPALLSRFGLWTFRSFWGQFGWMSVLMDQRIYVALLAFSVLLAIGAAQVLARVVRYGSRARRSALLLLTATLTGAAAGYLWYNITFVQHQARYLFPALPAISMAVAAGLDALVRLDGRRRLWLAAVPALGLVFLLAPGRWTLLTLALAAGWLAITPVGRAWQSVWYAMPLAALVVLDLVSLFGFIVPQLRVG